MQITFRQKWQDDRLKYMHKLTFGDMKGEITFGVMKSKFTSDKKGKITFGVMTSMVIIGDLKGKITRR